MKFSQTIILLFAMVSIQLLPSATTLRSPPQGSLPPLNTPAIQATNETTSQTTNLTFSPWPPRPFNVELPKSDYDLAIYLVTEYAGRPKIPFTDFLTFINDFGDNLAHKYPPPAYAPREAWSKEIDLISYTRWTIESFEGLLAKKVLTNTVLAGLDTLLDLLRRHGAASVLGYLHLKGKSVSAFKDASIELNIEKLVGDALNLSGLAGGSGFHSMSGGASLGAERL